MSDLDRRDFLKLVGVGAGGAAAAGCAEPVEKLIPYVIQPEEITPGIPVKYASTCGECATGCGLHVTTREGRPTKLEGNPDHPINQGKLCALGQAGIGRTYHPDRYAGPMAKSGETLQQISWEDATGRLVEKLRAAGSKVRVLGSDRGPTINGILDGLVSATGGKRVVYEPFAADGLRSAAQIVYGRPVEPVFDVSEADLIVDFGSNFLDVGPSPVEHARQWAAARNHHRDHGGARLVSIAPRLSMTGSRSDIWITAKPGTEGTLALALAKAVLDKTGGKHVAGDAGAVRNALRGADLGVAATQADVDRAALDDLVNRLAASKHAVALPPGAGAVGSNATSASVAVLLLNAVLGASGVSLPANEKGARPADGAELAALVEEMSSGQVDVLLIHDVNPVYAMPEELGFRAALTKVGFVVAFASLADETSGRAHLILPDHTPLESWGDAEPREGVRSIVQPTIRPLYDTKALGDVVLDATRKLGGAAPEGTVMSLVKEGFGGEYRNALSSGGVFSDTPTEAANAGGSLSDFVYEAPKLGGSGNLSLVAVPHSFLRDGRGAALPWLQETPDPVTRISWNSWAELSFKTADDLGVGFGDVVRIETPKGEISVSVIPRGGIRDDVVAVPTGQGHEVGHFASMAGDGEPGTPRGANVMAILPASVDAGGGRGWATTQANVASAGSFRRLALAQWVDNQRERELAPEVTLAALSGHGDHHDEHDAHAEFKIPYDPANDADPESDYRWGMTVDNDLCTGCGACVVACDIENNVPQVGEQQCIQHREMKWIRIDRYNGDGDRHGGEDRRPYPDSEVFGEVDVRLQPLLCQHCGAAPCESVCPVIATYHTDEGLNGMVYNRCVGTRYCANNCVYKVRRFNYWDYSGNNWPGLMDLMLNPDVTVRGRGVMEKCTFCVQRVASARQTAKDEGRPIADGEVQSACQQSCPTDAITFGNTRDASSEVVAKAKDARKYTALHDLNTRPAVLYLAQVRREEKAGSGHGEHDMQKGSH